MFSPAETFNRESSSTIEKGSLRGFRDQNPKSQWEARGDPDPSMHHKYAYRSRVLIYAEAEDIVTRYNMERSEGQVQAIELLHLSFPMDTLKLYLYWHRNSITDIERDTMFFLTVNV